MRKGKTKKTNFTKLARRTLAGALSLSMVFGTNIMTVSAEGGASTTTSPVTIGTAVDFSKDGVIVSSGNEHTVDGTSIKLGAVGTTPAGVEIVNPYASNAAIASETLTDALVNNGEEFNAFVYRKPVNNVQGNESNTPATDVFYVAPYTTVEEAQAAVSESAGKIEIVESLEELTYATKQGTDVVNLMTNWDPSYPNIKIMNLAQITGASESSAAALNFIAPEWSKGVSVSMWVKAASDKAVPVFTFINSDVEEIGKYKDNNCGMLQFMSDGSFAFSQTASGPTNTQARNRYGYKFDSEKVPTKNVGKWVYVTVNIKNDGAEVYYNGVKATSIKQIKVINQNAGVGNSNSKYFNYGYGANVENRVSAVVNGCSAYSQILNTKSLTGENAIKLASIDKILSAGGTKEDYYSMLGYGSDSSSIDAMPILNYISKSHTKFYVGGDDGTAWWGSYKQTDDGKDLEVKDLVLNDKVIDGENAFLTTEIKVAEEQPIESTNAAAMKAYDYTLDDMENAEGVNKLNEEHNEAAFATDEFNNSVIVLGAIADQAKGVELDNPFVGNKEIKETVAEALSATAISFNGWTVAHSEGDLKYNRVNDSATKTEAVDKFATNAKSSVEQYERRQLVKLAESVYVTGCSPELVGDSTTDYAVKFAEDGTTTDALTLIWSNMVADKNDKNGTGGSLANRSNFRKQLWNNNDKLQLSNEDFIKYTEGITAGAITLELAKNVLPDGKSFDEMYPAYASTADPANTTTSPYAFPYPTWKKGATVSTWVKVATDASATVLEFTDATATLNLTSDGKLAFYAGASTTTKNKYLATYKGETPASKVGEWVYVSLVIKNDNIDVYYNGVKAEKKMDVALNNSNYFNYGTGYATDSTAARIATMVKDGSYLDALKGYGESTDYSDISKVQLRNYGGRTDGIADIITFLTADTTKLYLGGYSNTAPYTDLNEGMTFGTISFYDYLADDATVAEQYTAAKTLRETNKGGAGDVTPGAGDVTDDAGQTTGGSGEATDDAGQTTGGSGNVTGGSDNVTGGSDNVTGGSDNVTGGSDNVTGGSDNVTPKPVDEFKAGDADCNKKVDLTDAKMVLKLSLGITVKDITEQGKKNADYDKSGKVDLNDAKYTLKEALGIKFTLPKK